jgi:Dolichyl-phosphate-mannose-protein mannosyltransferase
MFGAKMEKTWNKRMVMLGAILATVLTAVFFSLLFNRFSGLRSGAGEYVGGYTLVHGSVPFRDYFTTSPPLNQIKSGILLSLFGENLIVSRTAGMVERSLIALLLYLWLLRLCRPAYAALAAFATLVISTADFADPIASYNHDSILFAMLSGYFAGYVLNRNRSTRSIVWIGLSAGIAAGLSLLTKQTIGLGAVVVVPIVVAAIVWRQQTLHRAVTWLLGFAGGAAIPVGALLIWLATLGSLKVFLVAIFIKGPAAKAQNGGGDFLTRAIHLGFLAPRPMILATCGALIAVWLVARSQHQSSDQYSNPKKNSSLWEMTAVAIFGIACVVLGVLFSFRHWGAAHASWPLNMIFLTAVAVVALLILGTWQLLKGSLSERQAQIYLLAAVSFNIAFMLSLSYPMFSAMLLPGFGLIVACSLAGSSRLGRLAICVILLLVCVDTLRLKLDKPFGFGSFADGPVATANVRSGQAKLKGIRLPAATAHLVDGVVHIVASNTTPSDTIFTYPEMALFYALTDRKWPTQTASHNVDVVNDALARQEAARLLQSPPKVIIYLPETEEQLRAQEVVWRDGRRMGQRDIIAAIETLAQTYRLAGVFPTSPENQSVYVYVRPETQLPNGK